MDESALELHKSFVANCDHKLIWENVVSKLRTHLTMDLFYGLIFC